MSGSFTKGAVPRGCRRRSAGDGRRPRSAVLRRAAARRSIRSVHHVERGEETLALAPPVRRAGLEPEHVPQEVVSARVLVEPADEIGDRAVEVLGADDGRVEQETAGARLHRPRLVVGHALEHLELDPCLDAFLLAQHEAVRDVEEVVAGDAEVDGARVLGTAAVLDHALPVGVHLALGLVGRLRPSVELGLDALHGEIGALDDAELDRRAAAAARADRPPTSARWARCESGR